MDLDGDYEYFDIRVATIDAPTKLEHTYASTGELSIKAEGITHVEYFTINGQSLGTAQVTDFGTCVLLW